MEHGGWENDFSHGQGFILHKWRQHLSYANADFVIGLCKVTANVIVRVWAVLSGLQPPWIKCIFVPVVLWLKICMLTVYFPVLFLFWDFFFFP